MFSIYNYNIRYSIYYNLDNTIKIWYLLLGLKFSNFILIYLRDKTEATVISYGVLRFPVRKLLLVYVFPFPNDCQGKVNTDSVGPSETESYKSFSFNKN